MPVIVPLHIHTTRVPRSRPPPDPDSDESSIRLPQRPEKSLQKGFEIDPSNDSSSNAKPPSYLESSDDDDENHPKPKAVKSISPRSPLPQGFRVLHSKNTPQQARQALCRLYNKPEKLSIRLI